jgi:hypothetical protein
MKKQSKVKLTNEKIAKMLNKNTSWVLNQYYAVNNIDKVYGENGRDFVKKNKIGAGKIIADLQKKKRKSSEIQKKEFSIEPFGTTITVRCASKEVFEYVLSELKKNLSRSGKWEI